MVGAMDLRIAKINAFHLTVLLSAIAIVSPERLPILACHVPLDAELNG